MIEMITLKPTEFVETTEIKSMVLPEVPQVYQPLMDIAKKCLAPNPVDRPSAEQLITALSRLSE